MFVNLLKDQEFFSGAGGGDGVGVEPQLKHTTNKKSLPRNALGSFVVAF
jgi:hypothetical protein